MLENRPDQKRIKLTLFIYMDEVCKVLTENRTVLSAESFTFGSINNQDKEVQSALDRFYSQGEFDRSAIDSIDLMFVNSIFHKTTNGNLESYKNRLPAFVLYHNEFFDATVNHEHIAHRLTSHLIDWQSKHDEPALWFHLRNNILYVLFSTPGGENSITAFEVRKTLDVHYYILFNVQTLQPIIPELKKITISGELLNLDKVHNFFSENIGDKELTTFWQWNGLLGRPHPSFNQYLPEVNT